MGAENAVDISEKSKEDWAQEIHRAADQAIDMSVVMSPGVAHFVAYHIEDLQNANKMLADQLDLLRKSLR